MSLPPVAPHVVAAAVEALPARLRSRLDAMVEQARQWPVTPTADGGVEVTVEDVKILLSGPVDAPEKATCTCLLAPKCLHRTAVLSCAPILDAAAPAEETPLLLPSSAAPLTEAEKAAAEALWHAAIPLLEKGIDGSDAIAQADLLRAVHGARQAGLHRPSAAATAVVRRVRSARTKDSSFRLGELTDDVRELLTTCHQVSKDDSVARGRARRDYEPAGDLRLYGLVCEPLLTASGYAGAATILADEAGRIWTVAEVRPGEGDLVRFAADGVVELGEIRISHRELSRAGLLTPGAVASADGRLSHGRKVQAVKSAGCAWDTMPVLKLWQTGIADQLGRWLDALRLPVTERPGGHDLAFLDGVVAGAGRRGLLIAVEGVAGLVTVAAPWEDPFLPHVANLRQLAENAAGQPIRLLARFAGGLAGQRLVHGLGFSAQWLPERFGGHVDLGVDRLQKADLPGAVPLDLPPRTPQAPETPEAPEAVPPLDFARHTLERVVAAGRAALLGGVSADARKLADAQMGAGAELLLALGAAGTRRSRDVFGRLDPHDTPRLAKAWLAVAVYEQAAALAATRAAWLTRGE